METVEQKKVAKRDWTHYTIKSLAFWVVVAIIAGISFGMVNPAMAVKAKPGIDCFILFTKSSEKYGNTAFIYLISTSFCILWIIKLEH